MERTENKQSRRLRRSRRAFGRAAAGLRRALRANRRRQAYTRWALAQMNAPVPQVAKTDGTVDAGLGLRLGPFIYCA